ncbi:MAG: hypothetical protein WCG78_04010 [Candidatus Omnitrophota bacterium]
MRLGWIAAEQEAPIAKMFEHITAVRHEKLCRDPILMLAQCKTTLFLRNKTASPESGLLTLRELREFEEVLKESYPEEKGLVIVELCEELQPLLIEHAKRSRPVRDLSAEEGPLTNNAFDRLLSGGISVDRVTLTAPVLDLNLSFEGLDDNSGLPKEDDPLVLSDSFFGLGGFGLNAARMISNLGFGANVAAVCALPAGDSLHQLYDRSIGELAGEGIDMRFALRNEQVVPRVNLYTQITGGHEQERREHLSPQPAYGPPVWVEVKRRTEALAGRGERSAAVDNDLIVTSAFGGRLFPIAGNPSYNSHAALIDALAARGSVLVDYSSQWSRTATLEIVDAIGRAAHQVGIHCNLKEAIKLFKDMGYEREARVLERTTDSALIRLRAAYLARLVIRGDGARPPRKNLFFHITLGPHGIALCTAGKAACVTQPAIAAVSPTGAGDSTIAGMLALDKYDAGNARGAFPADAWFATALKLMAACGIATTLEPGTNIGKKATVDRYYHGGAMDVHVYTEPELGGAAAVFQARKKQEAEIPAGMEATLSSLRLLLVAQGPAHPDEHTKGLFDRAWLHASIAGLSLSPLEEDARALPDETPLDASKRSEVALPGIFLHSVLLGADGTLRMALRIQGRLRQAVVSDAGVSIGDFEPLAWLAAFKGCGNMVRWHSPQRITEGSARGVSKRKLDEDGYRFLEVSAEPVSDDAVHAVVAQTRALNVGLWQPIAPAQASVKGEEEPGYAEGRYIQEVVPHNIGIMILQGAFRDPRFIFTLPDIDHLKPKVDYPLPADPAHEAVTNQAIDNRTVPAMMTYVESVLKTVEGAGYPGELHLCLDPSNMVVTGGNADKAMSTRYKFVVHFMARFLLSMYQKHGNALPFSYTLNLLEIGLLGPEGGRQFVTPEEAEHAVQAIREEIGVLTLLPEFRGVGAFSADAILKRMVCVTGALGMVHGVDPRGRFDAALGLQLPEVERFLHKVRELGYAGEIHGGSSSDPQRLMLLGMMEGNLHMRLATDLIAARYVSMVMHAPEVALAHLPSLLREPRVVADHMSAFRPFLGRLVKVDTSQGDFVTYSVSADMERRLTAATRYLVVALERRPSSQVYGSDGNAASDLPDAWQGLLRLYYTDIKNRNEIRFTIDQIRTALGEEGMRSLGEIFGFSSFDERDLTEFMAILQCLVTYGRYVTAVDEGSEEEMTPLDLVHNLPDAIQARIEADTGAMLAYYYDVTNAAGSAALLSDASLTDDLEGLRGQYSAKGAPFAGDIVSMLLAGHPPVLQARRAHIFLHLLFGASGVTPGMFAAIRDALAQHHMNAAALEVEAYRTDLRFGIAPLPGFNNIQAGWFSYDGRAYDVFRFPSFTHDNLQLLLNVAPAAATFRVGDEYYYVAPHSPELVYYRIYQLERAGRVDQAGELLQVARFYGLHLYEPIELNASGGVITVDAFNEIGELRRVHVCEDRDLLRNLLDATYAGAAPTVTEHYYGIMRYYIATHISSAEDQDLVALSSI